MKRVWKPLDAGGLRLYKVLVDFLNHPHWNEQHVIVAASPTDAAKVYQHCVDGARWIEEPIITGHALNILMPADWWENGVPDAYCKECQDWTMNVVEDNLICSRDERHNLKIERKR